MNSQRQPGGPGQGHVPVLTRPARRPDLVLSYGSGADHVADVHLPDAAAIKGGAAKRAGTSVRALLIIFLHGGFWRDAYDRSHTGPLAEALAAAGFAVCAPEYRRTGQPGGGWPGTFDDVAAAVDGLPGLVAAASGGLVDPGVVVLGGHSAGGHLALWAASRHRLPAGSPWRTEARGRHGVVALAPVSDLASCFERALGGQAAGALMGGGPAEFPERYRAADPARLLPAGVPVRLVHGTADDRVPSEMSLSYAARAQVAGDEETECVLLPGAGHFDVIDPLSAAWLPVLTAFRLAHESVRRTGP
jgi:acetyl esterase/lipase